MRTGQGKDSTDQAASENPCDNATSLTIIRLDTNELVTHHIQNEHFLNVRTQS